MKLKLTLAILSLALTSQAMSMQKRSAEGISDEFKCDEEKDLVKKSTAVAPCLAEITTQSFRSNDDGTKYRTATDATNKYLSIPATNITKIESWLMSSKRFRAGTMLKGRGNLGVWHTKFTFVRKDGNQCRYRISKAHTSSQRACVSFDIESAPQG